MKGSWYITQRQRKEREYTIILIMMYTLETGRMINSMVRGLTSLPMGNDIKGNSGLGSNTYKSYYHL